MNNVLRGLSAGAILLGVVVGGVCAPFMFSSSLVDVVGAGLGCITGAILIAGGLLALTSLTAREPARAVERSARSEPAMPI